jgi:hypothetical protein
MNESINKIFYLRSNKIIKLRESFIWLNSENK